MNKLYAIWDEQNKGWLWTNEDGEAQWSSWQAICTINYYPVGVESLEPWGTKIVPFREEPTEPCWKCKGIGAQAQVRVLRSHFCGNCGRRLTDETV